jgi:hypothetical protein
MVVVGFGEGWFDRVWCEEFRCRRDAALAERVPTPHRLSDHEAAQEPEDGVSLDTIRGWWNPSKACSVEAVCGVCFFLYWRQPVWVAAAGRSLAIAAVES